MDTLFLELILWGGLLFFFWALKDGLGQSESEIDISNEPNNLAGRNIRSMQFELPDQLAEQIGTYKGKSIYRYAFFHGQRYEFDRACPDKNCMALSENERYVEPGLIYSPVTHAEEMGAPVHTGNAA